jgi:hypothetical protein
MVKGKQEEENAGQKKVEKKVETNQVFQIEMKIYIHLLLPLDLLDPTCLSFFCY